MNITSLQGIVAAPALPMLPDYAIDWSTLRTYLRWIASQRGIAVVGPVGGSAEPGHQCSKIIAAKVAPKPAAAIR